MKRTLYLLIAIVLFVSMESILSTAEDDDICFANISCWADFRSEEWGDLEFHIINSSQDAIAIADIAMDSFGERFSDYHAVGVIYDETADVWIVAYSQTRLGCGGYSVAIQGKTGEVLKIWLGE